MLNEKITKLLNEQVTKEFYSAYLYLDFSNYFADEGLGGFENWYQVQAKEERDHAMAIRRYLLDNGEKVKFGTIEQPDNAFTEHIQPLKAGLEHERFITESLNNIYAEAFSEKDFKTMQFLDWFVKEQVEEEKNADDLVKKMTLFGDEAKSLYMLDQELKARTYMATTSIAIE